MDEVNDSLKGNGLAKMQNSLERGQSNLHNVFANDHDLVLAHSNDSQFCNSLRTNGQANIIT